MRPASAWPRGPFAAIALGLKQIVFTAPNLGDSSSTSTMSNASNLCGTVKLRPMKPMALAPAIAWPSSSGATSKARYCQSIPSSAKASCIAGEAECLMGWPYTAQ